MLFLLHSISSQASQQEAIRQKEILTNEVGSLRGELQQVREDRDLQVAQVQSLKAEIARFNDCAGKTTAELEKLTTQTNLLEVCTRYFSPFCVCVCVFSLLGTLCTLSWSLQETCSSQKKEIRKLEQQMAAANEKLQVSLLFISLEILLIVDL